MEQEKMNAERFEIKKEAFGAFVAELRKEQGFTQKELAERLFLSDKAVSKWERGLSLPDITLLIPLADILQVTVTELLECQRISEEQSMQVGQVETLVQKAVNFSEYGAAEKRRIHLENLPILLICLLCAALEVVALLYGGFSIGQLGDQLLVMELLAIVFGCYFCLFAPEKLPTYYDENRISAYADGVFRINMPGVRFNNSNWRYIIYVGRFWCMAMLVLSPLLFLAVQYFFADSLYEGMLYPIAALSFILGSLFIPIYVFAKKYE